MKILLVQPARWNSPLSAAMVIEPLGLEIIGAHVAEHHDVKLLDMRWDKDPDALVQRTLASFNPDVVGATVITSEVNAATQVMSQAKAFNPDIVTIMGGPQPVLAPEALRGHYCDIAVMTEGEYAFRDVIQALDDGESVKTVPGLAVFDGPEMTRTPKRPLIGDLSELKLPKRSLTAEYRHRYFRGEWKPLGASFTTRGCHFRCTFCCVWLLGGAVYRTRGIDACLRDLSSMQEDYIFMAEDDSMFNVEYSDQLADAILASGIKKHYQFYSRSDLVVSRPELFEKWKRAGLDLLLIGMEMADDDSLTDLNKQNTTDNNEKAAKLLEAMGVEVISYFMVDPATFTVEHFKRLADYVQRMKLTHPIFFIMTPLPGTTQYRERFDLVATDNLDLFDFYHCVVDTKLPLGEFYRQFINLYRDCYAVRPDHVKNSSTFSNAVVENLVNRLEQEYQPYMNTDSLRFMRREPRLVNQTRPAKGAAPTLFPLKFKPGWARPTAVG